MMQQPPHTPDQNASNQQQVAQQMVLCPVRVVYETQILMPPGEQMTPNQTFFVNPQNQPPWATQNNIYPQNQMLYVQQMPGNIVPSVQTSMDQSPVYIQQAYPPMQQVLNQNLIAPNMQESIRQPMFQNVPQNMNVINLNQYGQVISMPTMQNMANVGPGGIQGMVQTSAITPNVQLVPNHSNSPRPELQQGYQYVRNVAPNNMRPTLAPQQMNMPRPVNMQVQETPPNVPNTNQMPMQPNMQNIQQNVQIPSPGPNQSTRGTMTNTVRPNFVQNSSQTFNQQCVQRPSGKPHLVNNQRLPPNVFQPQPNNVVIRQSGPIEISTTNYISNPQHPANMPQHKQMPNSRMTVPIIGANTPTSNHQIRPRTILPNQNQQKVPNQQRVRPQTRAVGSQNSPNNILSVQLTTPTNQHRPMSPYMFQQGQIPTSSNQVLITRSATDASGVTKITIETDTRKRKSESPDELKTKMTSNSASQINLPIQPKTRQDPIKITTSTEIGVNTSPIHRASNPPNIKKEIVEDKEGQKPNNKPVESLQKQELKNAIMQIINSKSQGSPAQEASISNDKLTRNTVFAQSRVRKLSSSSSDSKNSMEIVNVVENKEGEFSTEVVSKDSLSKVVNETVVKEEISADVKKDKETKERKTVEKVAKPKPTKKEDEIVIKECLVELEDMSKNPILNKGKKIKLVNTEKTEAQKSDLNTLKKTTDKVRKITDFIGKEIELSHGNINKKDGDDSYVLTHVLDGIVIQESNVAFPIRIPLREKTLPNMPAFRRSEQTEPKPETAKEPEAPKTPDRIMTISQLNLDSDEPANLTDDCKSKICEENLFSSMKSQTIKSWTTEELVNHLTTKGWHDTASLFMEHEIDGEALFLVSNSQLLEIGISENHANLLCNFIKS